MGSLYGGFPKVAGTFLGVSIIRTGAHRGLCWGPPILRSYCMSSLISPVTEVVTMFLSLIRDQNLSPKP